jgi:hypothetical protein
MPKEAVVISRYEGVFGIADTADLPEGLAYYAENIDMINRRGLFTGLNRDIQYSGAGNPPEVVGPSTAILDGTKRVCHNASNDTIYITSWTETAAAGSWSILTSEGSHPENTTTGACVVSNGDAARVGKGPTSTYKPQFAGYTWHNQFNPTTPEVASGTLRIVDAELMATAAGADGYLHGTSGSYGTVWLPRITTAAILLEADTTFTRDDMSDSTLVFDNSEAWFPVGSIVRYYVSLVYDGNQMSPARLYLEVGMASSGITYTEVRANGAREYSGTSTTTAVYQIKVEHDAGEDGDWVTATAATQAEAQHVWQRATKGYVYYQAPAVPATGAKAIQHVLRLRSRTLESGLPQLSERVTGVKVYRSVALPGDDGAYDEPEPKLIKHIGINDATQSGGSSSIWGSVVYGVVTPGRDFNWGGTVNDDEYRQITILDSGDTPGTTTFSQDAGFSHALDHMKIHYGLSCMANGYHVVGRAWVDKLYETQTWLFRSKPWRPDTFDWSNDVLRLPLTPIALQYFNGRIYAFCAAHTYVINPDLFDIEEEWEGIGIASKFTVSTSESGMFWADNANIYLHDGARRHTIGSGALRLARPTPDTTNQFAKNNVGWLNRDTTRATGAQYIAQYDSFLLHYACATTAPGYVEGRGLMYHIPTGRWCPIVGYAPFSTGQPAFYWLSYSWLNTRGEVVYVSNSPASTQVGRLFGKEPDSTYPTRRAWRYVSRTLGRKGQSERYYKIRITTPEIDKEAVSSFTDDPPQVSVYHNDPNYYNPITPGTPVQKSTNVWDHYLTINEVRDSYNFAFQLTSGGNQSASEIVVIRRPKNPR